MNKNQGPSKIKFNFGALINVTDKVIINWRAILPHSAIHDFDFDIRKWNSHLMYMWVKTGK